MDANTKQQLQGFLRWIGMLATGWLIGQGWLGISKEQASQLVTLLIEASGPVLTAGTLWLQWKVNNKKSILTAAAELPETKKIVLTDPKLAESVPRPEVATK